ncbi:PAAR domain-containing protein [Sorangium sp. So ce260]|uniref:PAAR domain-containing protein n=1 Tax=Sorangium sp. So ce260 TaxID=3133291 RepID=UPI003F5D6A65
MSKPAAKQGDRVSAIDTHIVMVPSAAGPVPTPTPLPFEGLLDTGLSATVLIDEKAAAVHGSQAHNAPPHVAPSGTFQRPPSNEATVQIGSGTVLIDGKAAARDGDTALTCNDPADAPVGRVVVASSTVIVGD